jgi:hypothetical protein
MNRYLHRYPTRYQQRLKEAEQGKAEKSKSVYVVNLKQRTYFECAYKDAPRMTKALRTPLTEKDALVSSDIGQSRWGKNDKVVFCPENCKGYVFRTYTYIY